MSAGRSGSNAAQAGGSRRGWRPRAAPRARGRSAHVAEFQRSRLLRATATVVCEHGYAGMTATAVIASAGVSRKTFYDVFESAEDCYLAAFEDSLSQLAAVATPAYERGGSPSERVRAALVETLAFIEREPDTGGLALSYLVGRGPQVLEPRASVLAFLQRVVEEGDSEARARRKLSPLAAEMIVAGALAVIYRRWQARPRDLSGLVNELMWMIVLPYVGPARAARQLTRAVAAPVDMPRAPIGMPMRDLKMRLTYRTARTLEVIAVVPGASNAELSARVGITDQGQISKLLTRLCGLGLIENTGAGQSHGAANAWRLTASGEELEAAIRRKGARDAG
jgi:AcrR family transcriptional regulator/DNA-binding MarR family transcriptional regulator